MNTHPPAAGSSTDQTADIIDHRRVPASRLGIDTRRSRKKGTIANSLTINEIRKDFSDAINRVSYGAEQIALTRRGRTLALIVHPSTVPFEAVTATVTSADARNNMSDVLNKVHYGNAILSVSRKSKALAVLLSPEVYLSLTEQSGLSRGMYSWEEIDSPASIPRSVKSRKKAQPPPP